MERVKTGVTGLDDMLSGGIPNGFVLAVAGGPGSGKSILATQFIWQGIQQNEDGLFILLSGEGNEVIAQASQFGYQLDNNPKFHFFIQGGDTENMTEQIQRHIEQFGIRRVVIDSISLFNVYQRAQRETATRGSNYSADALASKDNRMIIDEIRSYKDVTTMVLVEDYDSMPIEDKVIKFACDGVIKISVNSVLGIRSITVEKMRETNHPLTASAFEITQTGIVLRSMKSD